MIAKLTGIVDTIGEGTAVIDVGGVGYLVWCSQKTLSRLSVRREASVLVETQVRDDAITLYGFASPQERDWFRRLVTVQGVGAKAALAILSVAPVDELALAIASGDRALITRAPGVGAKLAARIIGELRDVAAAMPGARASLSPGTEATGALATEAVSALVHLGFRPGEAMDAVATAARKLGDEATLEALIGDSLAGLAPREHLS